MDEANTPAWRELKNATYSLGYKNVANSSKPILTFEGSVETNIEVSVVSDLDNWTCVMVSIKKAVATPLKIVRRIDRPTASVRLTEQQRVMRNAAMQSSAKLPETTSPDKPEKIASKSAGVLDASNEELLEPQTDAKGDDVSDDEDDPEEFDDAVDEEHDDEDFTPSVEVRNAVERVLNQVDDDDDGGADEHARDDTQHQEAADDTVKQLETNATTVENKANNKPWKKASYDRPVANYGPDARPSGLRATRSRTMGNSPYGKLKIVSDRPMWDPKLAGIRGGARQAYAGVQTNGQTNYSCKLCAMKFGVYQHWRIHMIQCLQKRKRRHMLKSRGGDDFTEFIPFDTKAPSYNLDELIRMVVEDKVITFQEPVRCRQCCLTMTSKQSLTNHLITRHDYRPFKCRVCGEGFKKHGGLYNHMMSDHKDARPSRCEICDRSFHTDQLLEKHKIVHSDVKPFTCDRCGQGFINEPAMRKHISKIHEPQNHPVYKCAVCEKTLATAASLRMHLMVHTGEKPHVCDTCGMRYRRRKGLRQHQRSVHEGTPTSLQDLTQSNVERANKCNMCPESFPTPRMLKQHLQKNHGAVPHEYRTIGLEQWRPVQESHHMVAMAPPPPPHPHVMRESEENRESEVAVAGISGGLHSAAHAAPPGTILDPYAGMILTHYNPYGH